jgi:predicted nucleic acid-binding protein
MSYAYIDTDLIIRLLTGDDLHKQARSKALFERVERGELSVAAPATVIADAVYVLASPRLYNLTRADVAALLTPLVRLPGFHIQGRRTVHVALQLYAVHSDLDFGDALIASSMQQANSSTVYSYGRDFDRIPGISREQP